MILYMQASLVAVVVFMGLVPPMCGLWFFGSEFCLKGVRETLGTPYDAMAGWTITIIASIATIFIYFHFLTSALSRSVFIPKESLAHYTAVSGCLTLAALVAIVWCGFQSMSLGLRQKAPWR